MTLPASWLAIRRRCACFCPPGSESHSYEPSPRDIIDIQQADLFLYAGGESDHWVEEILASMGDNAPRTFRLTDCVTLLAEETSASMEQEAHEHGQEEAEMDEHVWTSPKNAMLIVQQLCATLCDIAPQNTQAYEGALSPIWPTSRSLMRLLKKRWPMASAT